MFSEPGGLTETMPGKSAVIYARVSTARQAADDLPIAGQIEQCHVKAAEHGADVLQVFTDPGISGREEFRPGFQDAIAFCEERAVDYFVTWSPSRFARDHLVAGFYKRRMDKCGTQIVYCTMTSDRSTPTGIAFDSIMAVIDELYAAQVAADTKRSMMKNAREGFWNGGRAPFGFRTVHSPKNPKRRALDPVPEEAWLVLQVFNWRKAGAGARVIAGRLNGGGYLMRGKHWSASTVNWLLRNPTMNGRLCFGRRRGKDGGIAPRAEWVMVPSHAAIIPDELWNEVQSQLDSDAPEYAGSPHSTHLFTGMLRCGHCGGALQGETARGRSRRYSYYNCATWLSTRKCRNQRRPAPEVDDWLLSTITEKVFTPEVLRELAAEINASSGSWATERRDRLQKLEADLADTSTRKRKLFEVLEHHGRDAPNLADLTQRLRELGDMSKRIMAEIAEVDAQLPPPVAIGDDDLAAVREILDQIARDRTDVRRSRMMLRRMVDSVVLHSDRAEICYRTGLLAANGKQAVHSSPKWLPERHVRGTRKVSFPLPVRLRRAA